MVLSLSYLSLFILCFVLFIAMVIIHLKKLRGILELNNANELKRAKYVTQPYLLIASITSLLSVTFLSFALLKTQIPLVINLPSEYFYFKHVTYQSEFNLLWDILPAIVVVILANTYLIIKSQSDVGNWFEFWSGFIFGCIFMYTLYPIFLPLFAIGVIIILPLSLLSLSRAGVKESMSYVGFLIGALSMLVYPSTSGSLVFWLSLALGIGVVLGSFYLFGFRLFILAVPSMMIIILIILSNVTLGATLLLGVVITVLFILELKTIYKAVAVAFISIIYITVLNTYPAISFGIVFVVGLIITQWFIAEVYKHTVRTIFIKWASLQATSKKSNEKVNLSEHNAIPEFNKSNIDSKSYRFKWLNYLILKPLEKSGFAVDVIKEKGNLERIRGIFIHCSDSEK